MNSEKIYQIALTLVPKVGDVAAKKLIAYCGGAEPVFKESKKALLLIPGIGPAIANSIVSQDLLSAAEFELKFMEQNDIKPIYFMEDDYSFRLRQCGDAPIMLYTKGSINLNAKRIISIVGTRRATDYGKQMTDKIIEGLSDLNDIVVVSGLAYGIDIAAHKACLKYNVPTMGVLAHGLDRVYPQLHTQVAREMQDQGGLLSDFMSGTKPDRENFPKRNRIIAGLSDATLVVEARKKGGALITADIANSYSRDVFAVPGRVGDENSEGCNQLIRRNQAALIQSSNDICYLMGWDKESEKNPSLQVSLFVDLNKEEQEILCILSSKENLSLDLIGFQAKLSIPKIMQILLQLELKGLVRALPGNQYAKS
jgi:DNA processing protein